MFRAIYQSVFKPSSLLENPKGILFVNKYGWIFIIVRWFYYSILFLFRDYHGSWKPFIPPPFGIDLGMYVTLQRSFALPFGIFLMFAMSIALSSYLRGIQKNMPTFKVLNILGITFFLPFVIVQPIDQLLILTIGWKMVPVTLIHTVIAVWESFAATSIISSMCNLKRSEQFIGTFLLVAIWILITGALWR